MLDDLKKSVCAANLRLVAEGLVTLTFGNASGIDRRQGMVAIKPSGVSYAEMQPRQMAVVSLADGAVLEGDLRPSSDAPTHLALYRAFPAIGGIVHTHGTNATAWAQACREIPALGTTHADYFRGPVPCTRRLTDAEIQADYEAHTGAVIAERFAELDPLAIPAVLVANHGPFTWGKTVEAAVENAVVLEFIARMAAKTLRIAGETPVMPPALIDKHFFRKHGAGAYYGQKM
ncbi:MAG: L-ribulose-5-phosphate 4-epimerase AraD [Pirellulales bacterium]|nr:L-ribulose-5-phosphate 4-epimerase AraD [Pirellulales bacterium]